jgi:hypothetical protein
MVYKNIVEASNAQLKFNQEYEALLEKYGATAWENDPDAGSGFSFEYRTSSGTVQTLY